VRKRQDLLKEAERVGRQSGLGEKLTKYREQRRAYEGAIHGNERKGPSLPMQREADASPRGGAKGSVGDGLFR